MDDGGAGDKSEEKLWHQQAMATGSEHDPLGADGAGHSSDETTKVGVCHWLW